jgi:hypothetical protein
MEGVFELQAFPFPYHLNDSFSFQERIHRLVKRRPSITTYDIGVISFKLESELGHAP